MATVIDPKRFQSLGGTTRRYLDTESGRELSRREAIRLSTGLSPERLAVERAAQAGPSGRPELARLTERLQSMMRRGFSADAIAGRTRVRGAAPGRGAKRLAEAGGSQELVTPGTVRGLARGETAVTEQRAAAILQSLDKPEVSHQATVIMRDGRAETLDLVGETSVHKFHNYYDALVKLAAGDSSKLDRLKPSDLEVKIVGPSGQVETYRLNDDKSQLKRELKRGRLADVSLPSPETKRGKS